MIVSLSFNFSSLSFSRFSQACSSSTERDALIYATLLLLPFDGFSKFFEFPVRSDPLQYPLLGVDFWLERDLNESGRVGVEDFIIRGSLFESGDFGDFFGLASRPLRNGRSKIKSVTKNLKKKTFAVF